MTHPGKSKLTTSGKQNLVEQSYMGLLQFIYRVNTHGLDG